MLYFQSPMIDSQDSCTNLETSANKSNFGAHLVFMLFFLHLYFHAFLFILKFLPNFRNFVTHIQTLPKV